MGALSASFSAFYRQTRPEVVRVAKARLVDPVDAEDVAQEALQVTWFRWAEVATKESPRHWTLRVALNLAVTRNRRQVALRERLPVLVEGAVHLDHPRDPDAALWRIVAGLPKTHADAVVLRLVLDASYEDLAATLGCSLASARQYVHRAMVQLRAAYLVEVVGVVGTMGEGHV